ncbi:hypothetical protein PRZ48_008989 [Zasmidium cellare]|uniref:F-box domain-containing protein n=1 Tax=Zasmidium cellare TaxID=395010 RepID=A0ABR0EH27_ZASCE|nr:hypothetical protein PRZ48_008989 [Zasmidium cellare]
MSSIKDSQPPSKRRRRDPATGRFLPTAPSSTSSRQDRKQATTNSSGSIISSPTVKSTSATAAHSALKRKRQEETEEASQQESAVERVFGIHELVQEILSYLSPGELLRAQAVKQSFQAAYKKSKQLQLKTFERIPGSSRLPGPLRINPLLLRKTTEFPTRMERRHDLDMPTANGLQITIRESYLGGQLVSFQAGFQHFRLDQTQSWANQYIYDADRTMHLQVFCGQKVEMDGEDDQNPDVLDLYASVDVRNCPLGKLLAVGRKIAELSDFSYLDDDDCDEEGNGEVDPRKDAHWLANMDSELMGLIEGTVLLRIWEGRLLKEVDWPCK